MNIPQLSEPNWESPRGPPWWSYCPKAKPCSIMSHLSAVKWRDGSGTASGIQVVPEPMRSIETPSGSGTIPCFMAVSNIRGMPGISRRALSMRATLSRRWFGGMLGRERCRTSNVKEKPESAEEHDASAGERRQCLVHRVLRLNCPDERTGRTVAARQLRSTCRLARVRFTNG